MLETPEPGPRTGFQLGAKVMLLEHLTHLDLFGEVLGTDRVLEPCDEHHPNVGPRTPVCRNLRLDDLLAKEFGVKVTLLSVPAELSAVDNRMFGNYLCCEFLPFFYQGGVLRFPVHFDTVELPEAQRSLIHGARS